MNDFVINDPELIQLLDDVRKEIDSVTVAKSEKSKGARLAKNIGPEGSAGPAPEESSGAPAGPGPEGPGPEAGPASAEELLGQLIQAYSSMQPEELMIHYKAAKTAVVDLMQGGDPAAGDPGMGPEAGGPGMGSPEASPGPSMAAGPGPGPEASLGKTSMPANPNGSLAKSEQANAIETLLKSYNEKMELFERALVKMVGAPQRKAVTGVDFVSRVQPEKQELSKSEALVRLNEKAKDPNLKPSDREAINSYAFGSVNLSAVEHLLG